MIITAGGGPVGGPTSKDGAGFVSAEAVGWRAAGVGAAVLGTDPIVIAPGDRLRYFVYPELDPGLTYAGTHVAVDLRFTDGTLLSALGLADQYGMPFDPAGQGAARILVADQWNDVQVDLGAVAGRTVEQVLLRLEPPADLVGVESVGWIDGPWIGPADDLPPVDDPVAWVDTRRGTNASGGFSRGNNLPISAWPNGFNFLTPVTDAGTHRWPYEYQRSNDADNRPRLQGLGFSHQPSPWMGDRDQVSIMPVSATQPLGDPAARAVAFDHDDETARPDHYAVRLADGVVAELAPTDHGAIFRFRFPDSAAGRHVIIDTIDDQGAFRIDGPVITGWVDNGSEFGRTRMFCYGRFEETPRSAGPAVGGRANTLAATFAGAELVLRMATSMISTEQARHNLDLELGDRSFDEIRAAAHRIWTERLSVITVPNATPPQRRTVYGCLYRLNLYPNSQFENVGSAEEPDFRYASPVLPRSGQVGDDHTDAQLRSGRMYVNNGFWDTYRTAWPAYALLYPELAAELVDGFVQQYRDGGWVARWSSPGYADLMTGTSSDVAFADAYLKGVPLPDPLATYDAAVKNATVAPTDPAVGRKGVWTGLFHGYVSCDTEESVSWALEGYLNDAGIAAMAAALAEDPATPEDRRSRLREEAEYFRRRSLNYVLLFDPAVDFFQGRRPDGAFAQLPGEFDPCSWGGDFTETDGWNFAFHAAHDGRGLAALYGGPAGLEAKLDAFFSTPERADKKGTYRTVIHEMLEARAVRMGQFGFSNQPAHHIAYLYNYTPAAAKTQAVVREVLQRLFTGEQIGQGYPGDEDNGEMSAWYLFSALGLYPLRVGSDSYALGSPLFDRVELRPPSREPIVITAVEQAADHRYVQRVTVDGRPIDTPSITTAELAGSRLEFELGAEPSAWGRTPPPSISSGQEVPRPLLDQATPDRGRPDDGQQALFDDDAGTEFAVEAATATVGWHFGEPTRVELYTLTSSAEVGDPQRWRLEGSDDGTDWTLLDNRDGQTFGWRRQTRPFVIAAPTAFRHYRLTLESAEPGLALAEVELLA